MTIFARVEDITNSTLSHGCKVLPIDSVFGAVIRKLCLFSFRFSGIHSETPRRNVIDGDTLSHHMVIAFEEF